MLPPLLHGQGVDSHALRLGRSRARQGQAQQQTHNNCKGIIIILLLDHASRVCFATAGHVDHSV